MAQETIHSGNGNRRAVLVALLGLAVFVGGIAWLGNSSAPDNTVPVATQGTGD
ncbi:MAG: hypothetical protein HKN30_12290 [Sulfitobacter sp.]|nr:hypothetical protein [Sulfitobacter sp.]